MKIHYLLLLGVVTVGIGSREYLVADPPPPHLQSYLDRMRTQAARYFETAAGSLLPAQRSQHRHLLVLAALGIAHLQNLTRPLERRRLQDMLLAWRAARRAHT